MRHSQARRLQRAAVLLLGVMLVGCGQTAAPRASQATATPVLRHVTPGVVVRAAQLLTPTTGWVLTDTRLLITTDRGQTWADVTPPSNANAPLLTAFFLNSSQAWAVVRSSQVDMAADLVPLVFFTSADGGRHWAKRPMPATIKFDTPGPVYLTFVDAMRGWLVVDQGSHAGFMYFTGYETTDGGLTWTSLSYPQSAPVRFANELDGFSGGDRGMFVTHEAGRTWAPVAVPPVGASSLSPVFQLPVFSDDLHGVLAGGLADPSGGTAAEVFFTTSDGGRTFSLAATVPNPHPQTDAQLAGVMNGKSWLAAFLGAGSIAGTTTTSLKATQDGGRSWVWMPTVLSGAFMNEISFAGSTGWVIVSESGCRSFKTDCFTNIGLFQTADAGAHWQQVSVT